MKSKGNDIGSLLVFKRKKLAVTSLRRLNITTEM